MHISAKHKGMTLANVMIVIAVLGILAAMMMMSSAETVTTAKAAAIITNLVNLKKATFAWYMENRGTIQADGRVKIGSYTGPIQEHPDSSLHISSFFTNGMAFEYNQNTNNGKYNSGENTGLAPGCYGIYDAGKRSDNQKQRIRHWYVGYRFMDDEDAVRDKVKKRAASVGLIFTDQGDPYDMIKIIDDNKGKPKEEWRTNGEHAVWLNVF